MKLAGLLLLLSLNFLALTNYNIVFVHIGDKIPSYITHSIKQARLFNKKCPIYLITNKKALETIFETLNNQDITIIDVDTISQTDEHINFLKIFNIWESTIGKNVILKNFMKVTSERYLVLYDFIKKNNLTNTFHLENDVMLYIELDNALPIFEKNYKLAFPFDHDQRAPASFIYIKNHTALKPLVRLLSSAFINGFNDMQIPSILAQINPQAIDRLPILTPDYLLQYKAENLLNEKALTPSLFTKNFDQFKFIFDAAAIGQYLGGIDPHYYQSTPGFINEKTIFNVSYFTYVWQKDEKNRYIPYALLNDKKTPIANLHINCKNLSAFASDNPSIIQNQY